MTLSAPYLFEHPGGTARLVKFGIRSMLGRTPLAQGQLSGVGKNRRVWRPVDVAAIGDFGVGVGNSFQLVSHLHLLEQGS